MVNPPSRPKPGKLYRNIGSRSLSIYVNDVTTLWNERTEEGYEMLLLKQDGFRPYTIVKSYFSGRFEEVSQDDWDADIVEFEIDYILAKVALIQTNESTKPFIKWITEVVSEGRFHTELWRHLNLRSHNLPTYSGR